MTIAHQPIVSGRRQTHLKEIWRQAAIAWYFAWSDTRARYKRSVLGPFWLVLTTLIGVAGLAFVWGALLEVDKKTFVASITVGLVLWQMISTGITASTSIFVTNASAIKNIRTPSWRISLQLLLTQVVNLLHNIVVVILVLFIYPQNMSSSALLFIPGLVIVAVNLLWVIQFLGFLGARFRDLDPLVGSLMPVLFFLTPVLYRPSDLGARAELMQFNPLAYWVEIVRGPILGDIPHMSAYGIAIAMAVIGWIVTFWLTAAKSDRLPYWV